MVPFYYNDYMNSILPILRINVKILQIIKYISFDLTKNKYLWYTNETDKIKTVITVNNCYNPCCLNASKKYDINIVLSFIFVLVVTIWMYNILMNVIIFRRGTQLVMII